MTVAALTLDVFLSYAPMDREIAEAVERSLVDVGFAVRSAAQVKTGSKFETELRKLLLESDALVVVLTPNSIKSSSILVELGAALGLNMPIHLLLSGLAKKDLPDYLRDLPHSRIANTAQVGATLLEHANSWKFDDADRATLAALYEDLGVPADQLAYNATSLDKLSQRFKKATGKSISSSQLLHRLLTLRKRGDLPRLKRQK